MTNGIRVTTNAGEFGARFNRYLQRSIAITRRTTQEVVEEQARGLVRNAFKYTPPMAGRTFAAGYRASKKAIRNSLRKALVMRNEATVARQLDRARTAARREQLEIVSRELEASPSALVQFIKQHQKPDKRYPDSAPKHFSTVAKRAQVEALLERTIGVTAAGWCKAATRLRVIFPDWVGRLQSKNPGTAAIRVSGNIVAFRARNPNKHTDSATIQRALQQAYDIQAEAMRRRLVSGIAARAIRRSDVFSR
jgi:hypothetical protein